MFDAGFGSKIKNAKRLTHIIQTFAKNGFLGVLEKSGLDKLVVGESKEQIEKWSLSSKTTKNQDISILSHKLRLTFEELGPVFVKLGQMLAARDDLIPHSIVSELKELHQNVRPLSFKIVENILTEELENGLLTELKDVSKTPLAAGSIGQVHTATLKDDRKVVVKVKRPGVEKIIKQDLALLKILARRLEGYFEKHFKIDIVQTVEALGAGLESEIDFTREASNTEAIARNFADWDEIIIPEVFRELSTSKVLVLEFIEGVSPVKDSSNLSKDVIASGVKMFMKMILVDGEYHGDLHPGNLIRVEENKIGVIDFRLTYRLIDPQRLLLAGVFSSLLNQDFSTLGRRLSEIGEPKDGFEIERFQLALVNEITPYFAGVQPNLNAAAIIFALIRVSAQNDLYLPPYVILIFKTLISLEGVAKESKANFNLLEVCSEMTSSLKHEIEVFFSYKQQLQSTLEDTAYLAKVAPHQVRKILRSISKGNLNIQFQSEEINKMAEQISSGVSMVSVSLIFSALLISSALLVSSDGEVTAIGGAGFILSAMFGGYLFLKALRRKF